MFEEMQTSLSSFIMYKICHCNIKCFIAYNHKETRLSFILLQSHQYGATYIIYHPTLERWLAPMKLQVDIYSFCNIYCLTYHVI